MTEFKILQEAVNEQFEKMNKGTNSLFQLNVEKDELWKVYLNSFPEGTNEIYRERREYDCSCCRNFINNIGGAVTIIDNKIISIWDFQLDNEVFGPVVKALSKHVKTKDISDVY